jgi:hypothetical protein
MNIKEQFKVGLKSRIAMIILLVVLVVVLILIHYLKTQTILFFCEKNILCESEFFYGVLIPIYYSLFYLILSFLVLIFLPYSFLKLWLKVMIPYSIIALILIIETPALCGEIICFDRTDVAGGFSKLFLILTVLIIISKFIHLYFLSRRNKKLS